MLNRPARSFTAVDRTADSKLIKGSPTLPTAMELPSAPPKPSAEQLIVNQATLFGLGLIRGPCLELAATLRADGNVINEDGARDRRPAGPAGNSAAAQGPTL